jgi:hypothetical protein
LFTSCSVEDLKMSLKLSRQQSTCIHSLAISCFRKHICLSCLLDFKEESIIGKFIMHSCWLLTRPLKERLSISHAATSKQLIENREQVRRSDFNLIWFQLWFVIYKLYNFLLNDVKCQYLNRWYSNNHIMYFYKSVYYAIIHII